MAVSLPLIGAGISGASALGGIMGGTPASKVQLPQMFQMPGMPQASGGALGGIGDLSQYSAAGTVPLAQSTASSLYNNPYAALFQGGADTAANLGQQGALSQFNMGAGLAGYGAGLLPYAGGILQTGFDPQSALYNRTTQQLQEQMRQSQAVRGVATSPYGAGLENQGMSNFNIDWQNNLLQRQAAAAGAAGGLVGAGGGAIGQGAGLMASAPGQYLGASALPYNAYSQIGQGQFGALGGLQGLLQGGQNIGNVPIQDYLAYLQAGNQAGGVANQTAQLGLNQAQMGFQQNQILGSQFGQSLAGLGNAYGKTGWGSPFGFGGTPSTGWATSPMASVSPAQSYSGLTWS